MTDDHGHATPVQLAGWKTRLLDRIEDLSARHARVLGTEYPDYREGDGRGAEMIDGWRARLRDLEESRTELEIRAELAGVDLELIEMARVSAEQGEHWNHFLHTPPTVGRDARSRAPLLDAIAEAMWRLEHMAAVEAARQASQRELIPDPVTQQHYERNMTALWTQVNTLAAAVELTATEHAQMMLRDHGNWIRLVSRTVYRYTESGIEVRWRAYAWPGIAWEANRISSELLDAVRLIELSKLAPAPHVLISEATRALQVDIDEARADAFFHGEDVLDHLAPALGRSYDSAGIASWGAEPAGESPAWPPEASTSSADPA